MNKSLRDLAIIRSAVTSEAMPPGVSHPEDGMPMPDKLAGMPVMTVRFSMFGAWYPIDSWYEGRFLERVTFGAFAKTISERSSAVKVLFNHGMDFHIGDKILGVPSMLEERSDSPYAEVPMLDTSYNRDLVPGLEAGGYGSSFMFNVIRDEWNEEPGRSTHNPDGWPERTITEVRLLEFGPVTWPANPGATAGLRNTDWYAEQLRSRSPERFDALVEKLTDFRALHGLRTTLSDAAPAGTSGNVAATDPTDAPDTTPVVLHPTGLSASARSRLLALPFLTTGSTHHEPARAESSH